MNQRKIKTNLYGKEEMFRIIALGEATKLPILFVGPPGVAKTAVLMDYAAAMYNGTKEDVKGKTFIIELDEATKNSEIKGRPDMKSLLEDKRYVVEAPIADAEYVLINEVDKGSSGVRNTLLSVMREKALFLGNEVRECKWKLFAGSCNEINKDQADAPFWDRFMIKYRVERVQIDVMFNSWAGENIEFAINIPTYEEITQSKINQTKMRQFVSYIHNDVSDRTIYQIPLIVNAIKIIWECSDTEAIIKACDLIAPGKAANLGSQIEDKRITAVKTKISQIKSVTDVDQMGMFLHDLEKEFKKLSKQDDLADDLADLKNMLKKEVSASKVCKIILERNQVTTVVTPKVAKAPKASTAVNANEPVEEDSLPF